MHPAPHQKELFVRPTPSPGTVFVNDRVSVQTEEKQRVVFVQGVVFSHYSIDDRSAEAYAMVQLFEAGYADQNALLRLLSPSASTLPGTLKGGWLERARATRRTPLRHCFRAQENPCA